MENKNITRNVSDYVSAGHQIKVIKLRSSGEEILNKIKIRSMFGE